MKKFLKKLIVFAACIMLINLCINIFVSYPVQDERYESRYNYLSQNLASYNTLFFGTSRTLRHVVPSKFDSLNNVKGFDTHSFNLGTPANKLFETYYQYDVFLKDYALEKNKPVKNVFIEIHPMGELEFNNVFARKGSYWFSYEYAGDLSKYLDAKKNPGLKEKLSYKNYLIALGVRYFGFNYIHASMTKSADHDLWLGLKHDGYLSYGDEERFSKDDKQKNKLIQYRKDFVADTTTLSKATDKVREEYNNNEIGSLNDFHIKMLKNIIEKSKQQGISVKFVIQPRLASYKEVRALEQALPGYVINISNPAEYPNLWKAKYSYNRSHLNDTASGFFTQALSDKFTKSATAK